AGLAAAGRDRLHRFGGGGRVVEFVLDCWAGAGYRFARGDYRPVHHCGAAAGRGAGRAYGLVGLGSDRCGWDVVVGCGGGGRGVPRGVGSGGVAGDGVGVGQHDGDQLWAGGAAGRDAVCRYRQRAWQRQGGVGGGLGPVGDRHRLLVILEDDMSDNQNDPRIEWYPDDIAARHGIVRVVGVPQAYELSFGDGTTASKDFDDIYAHAYATAGPYLLTVTLVGQSAPVATLMINVLDATEPNVTIWAPEGTQTIRVSFDDPQMPVVGRYSVYWTPTDRE